MGTSAATTTGEHCGASCRPPCDCPAPLQGDELEAAREQAKVEAAYHAEVDAANDKARALLEGSESTLLGCLVEWLEADCDCPDTEGLHDQTDVRCTLTRAEVALADIVGDLHGHHDLMAILGKR